MKLITSHLNTIFCFPYSYSSISSFVLICNAHLACRAAEEWRHSVSGDGKSIDVTVLCVRPSYVISQSCDLE